MRCSNAGQVVVVVNFEMFTRHQAWESYERDGAHCNQFYVASDRKRAEVHSGDGLLVVGIVTTKVKVPSYRL